MTRGRDSNEKEFRLCRNGGDPNKKMTLTAEAITFLGVGPCKAVADMPYNWGPPGGPPDTERWVVEYKCPDGFNLFMFWRTDNNGPILTRTTEPGLVVRIMDHTQIAKELNDARRY